jgi:penicillin amidase
MRQSLASPPPFKLLDPNHSVIYPQSTGRIMAITFRWLLRLFIAFSVVFLLSLFLLYYFASRSLPDYNIETAVSGLQDELEIVRDNKGVPHIFGKSDVDVYFGLGFAHAQDRLWQMTLLRRAAQGRLSEIFGMETLEADEYIRRLDIYRLSQNSVQFQSPEAVAALTAYSAGVNAWLKTIQTDALGRGAPEFFLFKPEIAPWIPADSLAILKLMAVQSSDHLQSDILRARTALAVGADLMQDIMPDDPSAGILAMPEYASLFPSTGAPLAALPKRHALHANSQRGFTPASNVWAAHAKRTAAKASILAVDPHNALSAPGMWSLARMELVGGGVIGATIPGLPIIMSGRSTKLAWGFAASNADDVDIYIEQLNPNNPNEYLTASGFKPFKEHKIIIEIKGQPSKTFDLKWSDNGVVLPGDSFGLKQITPRGHVTSVRSVATAHDDKSFTALFNMMTRQSARSAKAQFTEYVAPIYNMVVADVDNIALQVIGALPKRNLNHVGQGRIPAQGWLERNKWQGFYNYGENPRVVNPKAGIVANTNNKTTDGAFPKHISHQWGDSFRISRLTKMMNERKIHTRDSFMEAQLDTISFAARATLPLIAKDLWFTGDAAPEGSTKRMRQQALELLANWNGDMNEHKPEPLIYAAWMRNLQAFLIRDELGPLANEFTQVNPVFLERVMRDIDGAGAWCDIRPSTRIETCTGIARQSLDSALLELSTAYGHRIDSWQWGQAHLARHNHQVFGSMPLINWVSNIQQRTSGGDHTLMRAQTSNTGDQPYTNVHAAGFRALVDFSDLESSLYIVSTGQSGHPLSRHYDDLSQLWRRGEYIPMVLDQQLARAGAVGITKLHPKLAP